MTTQELMFPGALKRGASGPGVRRLQEWLTLTGHPVVIDGDFGPATERALERACRVSVLTSSAWAELVKPLALATSHIDGAGHPLREVYLALAMQHYAQRPREVGGDNRGPWVRYYMNGAGGENEPWCAGFATMLLKEAALACGVPSPHGYRWGCDQLGAEAIAAGSMFTPHTSQAYLEIKPGWLFLVRGGSARGWRHVGIVWTVDPEQGTMTTIEGNSNSGGSANGIEVTNLTRGLAAKDFLIV